MKRLWISLALLAFLLLACIGSALAVNTFSEKTTFHLKEATQSAEQDDFSAAATSCTTAKDIWTSNATMLGALLRHSEADIIESGLMKLIAYAETADKDEFLALCAELIHDIGHVRDMELPLLRNIL